MNNVNTYEHNKTNPDTDISRKFIKYTQRDYEKILLNKT